MKTNTFNYDGGSLLVENMAAEASEMETFPVLIGSEVAYFHNVTGGFDTSEYKHVVRFIHEIQGHGSPYRVDADQASHAVEAHMNENYYNLDVVAVEIEDEYPDKDYVFSVQVKDYRFGPHSFSEPLTKDIDKRERSERP